MKLNSNFKPYLSKSYKIFQKIKIAEFYGPFIVKINFFNDFQVHELPQNILDTLENSFV